MKILEIILVTILPILFLVLVAAISFIFHRAFVKSKRVTQIRELNMAINRERIIKFETDLTMIENIIKTNPKYEHLFPVLEKLYDEIDAMISRTVIMYNKLNEEKFYETNSNKFVRSRSFNLWVSDVKDKIEKINELEEKFNTLKNDVNNQDQLLRGEFSFHQQLLRQVVESYSRKRILLDDIALRIDDLVKRLRQQEMNFFQNISADISKAANDLKDYIVLVQKLCDVINDGPKVLSLINDQIPRAIQNLNTFYQDNVDILQASLEAINYQGSLKNIAITFKRAKAHIEALKMDKAKLEIKDILKAVKLLEKQINFEVQARTTFNKVHNEVINQVKVALGRFVALKSQMKKLFAKDTSINAELNNAFNESSILAKTLDNRAMAFTKVVNDNTVAYSAKNDRLRILAQDSLSLTKQFNELLQTIWGINVEASLLRNKYKRAEGAFNEVLSNVKRQSIVLSDKEENERKKISEKLTEIAPQLNAELVPKDLRDEVTHLVDNSIAFYRSVGANIQLAEIASNLIRAYSFRRALDEKINLSFSQAEKFYLDGKYADALNVIVAHLEERGA